MVRALMSQRENTSDRTSSRCLWLSINPLEDSGLIMKKHVSAWVLGDKGDYVLTMILVEQYKTLLNRVVNESLKNKKGYLIISRELKLSI